MLYSRNVLGRTLKSTLNYKVDAAAHIHSCCLQRLRCSLPLNRPNNEKICRAVYFGTILQVRCESSGSSQPTDQIPAGLDPIPEPPTPLITSDVTSAVQNSIADIASHWAAKSTVEPSVNNPANTPVSDAFPDVYKIAMEVFSSLPVEEDLSVSHAGKLIYKTTSEPLDAAPEIYKTAMEIWKDPEPPEKAPENPELSSSSEGHGNLESFKLAQELPGGKYVDAPTLSEQSADQGYTSIFDSLPEPPNVSSSVVESFGNEPSFSSLGLGGWYPSGIVQNCMEYLHVDCGLPWWGSVVCGTIIIRLLLFPVVIMAQRNMAKLNNNMPQMQHLQARLTEARQRGDKFEAAKCSTDMMKFMQEKEINPLKNMVPPFIQAPIFISMFIGLREMANLPVESLKTGGILWFVDLTVPDQFYLLPVITSATLFCTIKVGADGSPGQASRNGLIMQYVLKAVPIVVLPFTIGFPGLILVYWTTANFMSLLQVGILRIPKVRRYFKIEPLIRHQQTKMAIEDKGFIGNIKEAWNNMKITSELEQRERADKMAFLKAGREPIKKTYKYDPTKIRPAIQAKKN